MTNHEKYMSALAMLYTLAARSIISKQDFIKAEKHYAQKYCIKKGSIYRPNDLINFDFRVIYSATK